MKQLRDEKNYRIPPPSFNEGDPLGYGWPENDKPRAPDFLVWIIGGLIGWLAVLGAFWLISSALLWFFP